MRGSPPPAVVAIEGHFPPPLRLLAATWELRRGTSPGGNSERRIFVLRSNGPMELLAAYAMRTLDFCRGARAGAILAEIPRRR